MISPEEVKTYQDLINRLYNTDSRSKRVLLDSAADAIACLLSKAMMADCNGQPDQEIISLPSKEIVRLYATAEFDKRDYQRIPQSYIDAAIERTVVDGLGKQLYEHGAYKAIFAYDPKRDRVILACSVEALILMPEVEDE